MRRGGEEDGQILIISRAIIVGHHGQVTLFQISTFKIKKMNTFFEKKTTTFNICLCEIEDIILFY